MGHGQGAARDPVRRALPDRLSHQCSIHGPHTKFLTVPVELTEVRKPGGILSKKITLGEDGRPKSDGSGCRLTIGKARRHRMNGGDPAGALAVFVNSMPGDAALTLGRIIAAAV